MAGTAKKSDPKLWERVKKEVTGGEKGGRKGQWSARKAQLASAEYKKRGGGYKGPKTADNHLARWTEEEWGTRSGRTSRSTGERYLPRKARKTLSEAEYARTTAKKRRDTAAGKQFSSQPRDVAKNAARARKTGTTAASGVAKRRPAAGAAPARGAAAPRTTSTRRPAASAKTTSRKGPARADSAACKAASAKSAARKGATGRSATTRATGRKAAVSGAARKPAPREPAAKRRTAGAAARRSTRGGPKR